MKYFSFLALFLISVPIFAQSTGKIIGKVIDKESKELLLYANVALYKNGVLIKGTQTDFDGKFEIVGLEIGKYDIEAEYVGYKKHLITNITIQANRATEVKLEMKPEGTISSCLGNFVFYQIPLYENNKIKSSGRTIGDDTIEKFPSKDINTILRTVY